MNLQINFSELNMKCFWQFDSDMWSMNVVGKNLF